VWAQSAGEAGDFGAGYIGGGWPDETHTEESGNTGYLDYFNGEIADITVGGLANIVIG
jgi:hypothetical protein